MNANELYAIEEYTSTNDISSLIGCYFNHVEEAGDDFGLEAAYNAIEAEKLIELRILRHTDIDYRRYWRLVTVWFDDLPVMVVQNAGREGDDHSRRFITDSRHFHEMCKYIGTKFQNPRTVKAVDPNKDMPELTTFYGDSYER